MIKNFDLNNQFNARMWQTGRNRPTSANALVNVRRDRYTLIAFV